MKATELPKVSLATEIAAVEQTLVRAEAVLGYKPLERLKRELEKKPLASALAKLDIDILEERAVLRYQLTRMHEAQRAALETLLLSDTTRRYWGWYSLPRWEERELSSYEEPIPEFVLNKAIQIKERLPEVTFEVEHLNESPDPFLKAKLNDEEYYIEAWEEPSFENRGGQ